MYALRKSYGPYSQGTRVDVDTGTILGEHQMTVYSIGNLAVPAEYVVKRRNMTRYGPAVNSRQRRKNERAAKRALGLPMSATPDDAARRALDL